MTLGRILLLLPLLAAALVQARAAPLDAESCAKLMNEHGQLEQAGVEADMAKGPEWGKANLLPEKLDRIRRFIEIEEQLLFRCRQKSLVSLPPEVEAAPGSDDKDRSKDRDQDKDKNAAAPPTTRWRWWGRSTSGRRRRSHPTGRRAPRCSSGRSRTATAPRWPTTSRSGSPRPCRTSS